MENDRQGPEDALLAGSDTAAASEGPWVENERRELGGAIAMVAGGFAVSVMLCGLEAPEALIAALAATATSAGVVLRTQATRWGSVDIVVARR